MALQKPQTWPLSKQRWQENNLFCNRRKPWAGPGSCVVGVPYYSWAKEERELLCWFSLKVRWYKWKHSAVGCFLGKLFRVTPEEDVRVGSKFSRMGKGFLLHFISVSWYCRRKQEFWEGAKFSVAIIACVKSKATLGKPPEISSSSADICANAELNLAEFLTKANAAFHEGYFEDQHLLSIYQLAVYKPVSQVTNLFSHLACSSICS